MSRLFIDLYLDEDVSTLVGELVRSRQFRVTTTAEAGNCGRYDPDQLAFAAVQNPAILTHNRRDFESLATEYVATGKRQAGIIIAVRRPEPQIAQRLLVILDRFTAEEMENQLLYI